MNHEHEFVLALIILFFVAQLVMGPRRARRRAREVDAMFKRQGIAWPGRVSPGVMLLAQDRKIAAIQLHREQNPGLGLREAKDDVEPCLSHKQL